MPTYSLIEYSDNYSDTSGTLWGFKTDEVVNSANMTNGDDAPSFNYKADSPWAQQTPRAPPPPPPPRTV